MNRVVVFTQSSISTLAGDFFFIKSQRLARYLNQRGNILGEVTAMLPPSF